MAVKLYEKIDLKIEKKEKTSVYPITVKLELSLADKESIKLFKEEEEKKYIELKDASKKTVELNKKISRLVEDIEDIDYEIEDCEDSSENRSLRLERRDMRKILRALEDKKENIAKEFDATAYQESYEQIATSVAKKSFALNVEKDEKSEALEKAMVEQGVSYVLVVAELSRLIGEAKEKKKRRS